MLAYLLNALNATAATTAAGAPSGADEMEMHPDRSSPRGIAGVPEDSRDAKILMPACTRATRAPTTNADSALIAATGKKGVAMTQQKDGGKSEGTAGKKKRKRGGAGGGGGAGVFAATATTPTNHQVQIIRADERSLLPFSALGTHLQLHAALMMTRSAIRRAYSTSNLGGIILISTGSTGMLDIDSTGGYGSSMMGLMGHPVLAIRYCGWKGGKTGAIEVEYARAMTLGRAERFLGCCTGAAPSRWEKFFLPARLACAYLSLLQTTCKYRGYSCVESGCKVHEGVLP